MARRLIVTVTVTAALLGLAPAAQAAGERPQPTPPQNCEDVASVSGQPFECKDSG